MTTPSKPSRRQRWSELGVGERRAAALEALEAALAVRGFTVTRVKGRSMIVNARRGETAIEIHLQSSMNRGPAYWRKSLLMPAAGRYAALALLEGRDPPKLYLIPSLDWRVPDRVLVDRAYEDDASDPEWGINLPGVRADLERYAFDRGISRV